MRRLLVIVSAATLILFVPLSLWAQKDKVKYVPRQTSGILDKVVHRTDSIRAVEDSITASIRHEQAKLEAKADKNPKEIRFDLTGVEKPGSPDDFKQQFHFPPRGQYRTGTCWCFSGTSFIETEIFRQTGQKVKLSEMYSVYNEYLEKTKYFVAHRGQGWNGEGSEQNAVLRMIKMHGAMPEEVYSGGTSDLQYDHSRLSDEIDRYFSYLAENNFWDENEALGTVRAILNKYMGEPPSSFKYNGKKMTPEEFARNYIKINLDDYVNGMSTLSLPFHQYGVFDVGDNWWRDSSYYNLPLDEWYGAIKSAIQNGYTVALGGDVSEPGYNGMEDAAIVPDFDIPQDYITQDAREFRFYNHTTGDDHGIHVVGLTQTGGHDWYLIKDSSRRVHQGKFEGYMFYRNDYIRLKMLTFLVHKDALKGILPRE